jgi:hypothetical protein
VREAPVGDTSKLGSFPAPTAISEQLVTENLKLAFSRANRYAARTRMPLDDLEAAAYVGLVRGARAFDPARGWTFSTCAVRFIDGAILRYLRDRGHAIKFPMRWREIGPKVRRLLNEGKTLAEVTEATGMEPDEIRAFMAATAAPGEIDPNLIGACDPLEFVEPGTPEADDLERIQAEAFAKLIPADRVILQQFWSDPSRQGYPMRQLEALDRAVRRITGPAQQARSVESMPLGFNVELAAVPEEGKRTRRSRTELDDAAEQMGLLALLEN